MTYEHDYVFHVSRFLRLCPSVNFKMSCHPTGPSVKPDSADFLININPKKGKSRNNRGVETNYIRKFNYKIKNDDEGQTALVEEMRNAYRTLARTAVAVGKRPFEDLCLDRRIILKYEELNLLEYNTA